MLGKKDLKLSFSINKILQHESKENKNDNTMDLVSRKVVKKQIGNNISTEEELTKRPSAKQRKHKDSNFEEDSDSLSEKSLDDNKNSKSDDDDAADDDNECEEDDDYEIDEDSTQSSEKTDNPNSLSKKNTI